MLFLKKGKKIYSVLMNKCPSCHKGNFWEYNNPYKNIHFNFMNSLSPNNDYFLKNNVIKEHTSKNYYCNYASRLIPYVLVDGRVSACCRDYDGSLVVDDLNKNSLTTYYQD